MTTMTTVKNRPRSRAVRAREVRTLLVRRAWSFDEEIGEFLRGIVGNVLRSDDGKLLIFSENGAGRLYESREEALAILRAGVDATPAHPFTELLPQGKGFIDEAAALAERAPEILGIDASRLDRSEASLEHVERAVRRIGARVLLTADRFPPLVACVGQVIETVTNGTWEALIGADGVTWEPGVRDPSGGFHAVAVLVFKEVRLGRRGSIRGAVNGSFRACRLASGAR